MGVSADSPGMLTPFRRMLGLPFTLLSDPQLSCADSYGVGTVGATHPMALTYPKNRFLQPALLIWRRDGSLAHQWLQRSKITNLYGASNRPSPAQILELVSEAAQPAT